MPTRSGKSDQVQANQAWENGSYGNYQNRQALEIGMSAEGGKKPIAVDLQPFYTPYSGCTAEEKCRLIERCSKAEAENRVMLEAVTRLGAAAVNFVTSAVLAARSR
jgi:hypothetical protein